MMRMLRESGDLARIALVRSAVGTSEARSFPSVANLMVDVRSNQGRIISLSSIQCSRQSNVDSRLTITTMTNAMILAKSV